MSIISFEGRVAIVTGAGGGLGKQHALGLAARGAKVIVNDFGGALDGTGGSTAAADAVVDEIRRNGGLAFSDGADVSDAEQVFQMAGRALAEWGRVDILVNNAGILRDKTFAKMELADFRKMIDVHLIGAANCCKAVWEAMRQQQYGRIVMTTSSSGLYGNFGQSNYGAAKAGVIGLMNVLHLEGAKYGIRVNALAPTAATRMTADLMPAPMAQLLRPEMITPGLLYLVSEEAPSRTIMGAGAGVFSIAHIVETEGVYLPAGDCTPEGVRDRMAAIDNRAQQRDLLDASEQTVKFAEIAAKALGVALAPTSEVA